MNRALQLALRATEVPEVSVGQSLDSWAQEGRKRAKDNSWFWADWWVRGERYGEDARAQIVQANDWHGPSYVTLRNYGGVATAFPLSHRCDSLSFSHHLELASVREAAERKSLMQWALKEDVSRKALHAEIKRRRSPEQSPTPQPDPAPTTEPAPAPTTEPAPAQRRPPPPQHSPEEIAQMMVAACGHLVSQLQVIQRDPAMWDRFVTELAIASKAP